MIDDQDYSMTVYIIINIFLCFICCTYCFRCVKIILQPSQSITCLSFFLLSYSASALYVPHILTNVSSSYLYTRFVMLKLFFDINNSWEENK